MSDKILTAISFNADSCETLINQLRSQHNAIHACLNGFSHPENLRNDVDNLLLTAELLTDQLCQHIDSMSSTLLRRSR